MKTRRQWIQLDYSHPDALRAEDIPYDATMSVYDAIRLVTQGESGYSGAQGTSGYSGSSGSSGYSGSTGAIGPTGLSGYSGSSGSSGYSGTGPGKEVYDIVDATAMGQNVFQLSEIPVNPYSVRMVPRGGIEYTNSLDYTVSGQIVTTLNGTPSLFEIGDQILFKYFKA